MKNKHYYVLNTTPTPIIMVAKDKTHLFGKPRRNSKMYTTIEKARQAVRDSSTTEKIQYQLFTTPLHYVNILMDRDDDRNPWVFADSIF